MSRTQMHARKHTHTYEYTHGYTQTHRYTHTQTRAHMRSRARTHAKDKSASSAVRCAPATLLEYLEGESSEMGADSQLLVPSDVIQRLPLDL